MTARSGSEALIERMKKALAVGGDTHDLSDIVAALRDGRMQAFEAPGAIVVTEVVVFPRKRALNVVLAAGDLDAVKSMQPQLDDFARKTNCDFMQLHGRRGWERALASLGWSAPLVTMVRGVHHG